jgi:hypothetical protein
VSTCSYEGSEIVLILGRKRDANGTEVYLAREDEEWSGG